MMTRLLSSCALALVLTAYGTARADEPVRLSDRMLDRVTAAYATAAGWQFLLSAKGVDFDPDLLLFGGEASQSAYTGDSTDFAEGAANGTATTQDFGNGSLTVTQFQGTTRTGGDGTADLRNAGFAQGDLAGTGGVIVPLQNADGSVSYRGVSWAWGFDYPTP